jgi:hypothetical protein
VGGTCGTHGRSDECVQGFYCESPKESDPLKDQNVAGRMESEWLLGRLAGGGALEWIKLAQDRGRWRALVNTVMDLPVLAPRNKSVNLVAWIIYTDFFLSSINTLSSHLGPQILHWISLSKGFKSFTSAVDCVYNLLLMNRLIIWHIISLNSVYIGPNHMSNHICLCLHLHYQINQHLNT